MLDDADVRTTKDSLNERLAYDEGNVAVWLMKERIKNLDMKLYECNMQCEALEKKFVCVCLCLCDTPIQFSGTTFFPA